MSLQLQIPSFLFGLILGLAIMLLVGQSYRFLFGSKKLRELGREVQHMRKVIDEKDRFIKKSIDALQKEGLELPQK